MCSINTVEIPKQCTSLIFWNIFEYCLRHYNMIVLGVYKRHSKKKKTHRPLGELLKGHLKKAGERGNLNKSGKKKKKGAKTNASASAAGNVKADDDS